MMKKQIENQTNTNLATSNNCTNPRFRTSFIINEVIPFEEDETIEYKNYHLPLQVTYQDGAGKGNNLHTQELIDNLKKQISGLLNNKGGRIYIGINDDRKVEGVRLAAKQRDQTRNQLINLTTDFYPKCRLDKIKVTMIPVKEKSGEFQANKFVVKIIVKKGEPGKLYSVCSRFFKSYMRLHGQCVQLSCMEIEKEIIDRSKIIKKEENSNEDDFIDPEPEINIVEVPEENLENENKSCETSGVNNNIKRRFRYRNETPKRSQSSSTPRAISNISDNILSGPNKENLNRHKIPSEDLILIEGPKAQEIDLTLSINKSKIIPAITISNINKENNLDDCTYLYKKQILERRNQRMDNNQDPTPVYVLITNLPENIKTDEMFELMNNLKIQVDTGFRIQTTTNKIQKMGCAKLRVVDRNEAKELKEKLKDFVYMSRKLEVTYNVSDSA
jgi:hypothetical protein